MDRSSSPTVGIVDAGTLPSDNVTTVATTRRRRVAKAVRTYLRRLRGAHQTPPPLLSLSKDMLPTFVFTSLTMTVLAAVSVYGFEPLHVGLNAYLPSFGASCALVMCLSKAPGAQPRAIVLTHVVGAFLGVSWGHITHALPEPLSQQLACAFAVAMLVALMMLCNALQPSASATTCLAAFHVYGQLRDQGFLFVVAPALLGACVVVVCGWLLNNGVPWRSCYPLWW